MPKLPFDKAGLALLMPALTACVGSSQPPPAATPAPSAGSAAGVAASEAPADGLRFESLLPDATLAGFRRVPLDPLADKPVWTVSEGHLVVDGIGAKEMLLTERSFGDGVLRVEWRFVPPAAGTEAPTYNGGVYVRTPLDGKHWVQLQVAHVAEPPVVGDLIALVPGRSDRVDVFQNGASPERPVGEWNLYEVTAQGPRVELAVNGRPTVVWEDCPWASGHLGLQAEGAVIEVRRLEFAPL